MKITGTGSALPEKVVTNDMLAGFLDTSDSWITSRTGIRTRHLLSTETLTDLALKAANAAIVSSGVQPEDIDYLICSNVANSYVSPSLGSILLAPLGLCCPTFDLNGACAGLVYSLDIADSFLKTGRAKNILIVAAEEPSRFCNWHERETSVLFGDGAAALVVTEGEGFKDFLSTALEENPLKGEYYIQTPINKDIAGGTATYEVLTSSDKWFGVTYKEDKPEVVKKFAALKADGTYPVNLWD